MSLDLKNILNKIQTAKFYSILDSSYVDENELLFTAENLINSGIDLLQFRAKDYPTRKVIEYSIKIHNITEKSKIPLIINDHPEAVVASKAEGLHVGQDDISPQDAKLFLEKNNHKCIIGKSNHSITQIKDTLEDSENIDYLAYGPVFQTNTKPTYIPVGSESISSITKIVQEHNHKKPLFFIGGINKNSIKEVSSLGAERVVIVSDLLMAKDFKKYVSNIKSYL